jgi:hypothetical protein
VEVLQVEVAQALYKVEAQEELEVAVQEVVHLLELVIQVVMLLLIQAVEVEELQEESLQIQEALVEMVDQV